MTNENQFLLHAVYMGIYITFVYDWLRIFRRVIPHKQLMVSLEDVAFWIYCAIEVFLLMHRESNGTLRWFAVLGALVGMILYKKLLSRFLVKYASLILKRVMDFLVRIGKIIFSPIGRLLKGIRTAANKTSGAAKRRGGQVRRHLKKKLTFFLKVLKMNL